ncbi:hypothetical protein Bca4012_092071 [Brassica carinata]|uniref:Uncharacterized protein n=2 Tax=Brassica TaxID=3705 RepID=A0A8S9MG94_BRACR|nr:hypothetical protein F2Q68_00038633 [Brassica cretica]KAG2255246.1 hypothetical protein Bca52824_074540 [Brassica carinata]
MSSRSSSSSASELELQKDVKRHEVALDELSCLSSSRSVYQRNGNLFFLTAAKKVKIDAEKQLDHAKSELAKIRSQTR